MMRDRHLITTAQSARILDNCTPDNVRKLAREGRLPVAAVVGRGQRLFDLDVVQRLAVERRAKSEHGER